MAHFLETATIDDLDDLAERLTQSLALGAFSDRELGEGAGPNTDPNAEFAAMLQRLRAERGLYSLPLLNIVVGSLKPEDVPLLGFVQLAPAVVVSIEALRWNSLIREFVYITETGGIRRLARAVDFFRRGTDKDEWAHCLLSPLPRSPASSPLDRGEYPSTPSVPRLGCIDPDDATHRLQRTALELETVLAVVPVDPACPRPRGPWPISGTWRVIDIHGRWRIVDRRTGTAPAFAEQCGATRAADAAILGEHDRYIWFDRFNSDDPSCS